jgi:nucleoid DNA-binding protein
MEFISPNGRPRSLIRGEAESVVTAIFEEMTEALKRGEAVELPFGKFEVKPRHRPALRG